jgi:hypothetical protein
MATQYATTARLIWSLTASGLTTISAAGNSGAWTAPANGWQAASAIDLRDVTDVSLMVSVTAVTSSPSLTVSLNVFDDLGNSYAAGLTTAAIIAPGTAIVSGGLHGLTGKQLVLPMWGQVAWTCTGGSVTGTEIALYGR